MSIICYVIKKKIICTKKISINIVEIEIFDTTGVQNSNPIRLFAANINYSNPRIKHNNLSKKLFTFTRKGNEKTYKM